MESTELSVWKQQLHAHCLGMLRARATEIVRMQHELLAGAADDSKSSAGDKHETARAMMQLEQEKLAGQLQEVEAMLAQAARLVPDRIHTEVHPGSLVCTDRMRLYLLAGIGKVTLNGFECFVLSPGSPLGRQLIELKAGDTCTFNGQRYRIEAVG